jgi:hypothetical protein
MHRPTVIHVQPTLVQPLKDDVGTAAFAAVGPTSFVIHVQPTLAQPLKEDVGTASFCSGRTDVVWEAPSSADDARRYTGGANVGPTTHCCLGSNQW